MQDARTAQQILEAIELLGELLWERFGAQLLHSHSQHKDQAPPWWQDPSEPLEEIF